MRQVEPGWLPLLIIVVGLAACSRESATAPGQASSAAPGGAASSFTERANRELAASLPLAEQQDFEDAKRGFIATDDPLVIAGPNGAKAWDFPSYAFVEGDAPATVNPSLWRQAKLNGQHGLFEVVPGIHQVRGYDISNMTLIEGKTGWIVVDPLTVRETAAAAIALARKHLGDRPVSAIIFTHSHIDHFGGVEGVLPADPAAAARIPHRRAARLHRGSHQRERAGGRGDGTTGRVHVRPPAPPFADRARRHRARQGPGQRARSASASRPIIVDRTPQDIEIDGVKFVFQYTPESEAPAELDLLPAGSQGVVRRRDRLAHAAQPLHAARREGARRREVERLHRRCDPPLRRHGSGVREPSLAGVGQRPRAGLPEGAARHVPLHPRPDAAPRQRGPDVARDRRAARAALDAAQPLRQSRLLRHRAPQRQGRVPDVLRLVRRQPGESQSAAAGGRCEEVCRCDGRRRGGAEAGRRLRSRRATIAGPRRCSTTSCSPSRRTRRRRPCSPRPTTSSATRPSQDRGATCT